MKTRVWLAILVALLAGVSCGRTARLETRTFNVRHLQGWEIEGLLKPYVWSDRPGASGAMSLVVGSSVTVRETADNLERIARVLAEYDRPAPAVRLHFQLIQADGAGTADPAIAEVEAALRRLFRFRGYHVVAEATVVGMSGSEVEQIVGGAGDHYVIRSEIHEVRGTPDSGTVRMSVLLSARQGGNLRTAVTLRGGQTAVLGNTQLRAGQGTGTLILTVRPELVPN